MLPNYDAGAHYEDGGNGGGSDGGGEGGMEGGGDGGGGAGDGSDGGGGAVGGAGGEGEGQTYEVAQRLGSAVMGSHMHCRRYCTTGVSHLAHDL